MKLIAIVLLVTVLCSGVKVSSRAKKNHQRLAKAVQDGSDFQFADDCPDYWLGDGICDADFCGEEGNPNNPFNNDCNSDGYCDCETETGPDDGSEEGGCKPWLVGDGMCDWSCFYDWEHREAEFYDCCPPGSDSNGVCKPECIDYNNYEIDECCREEYKVNGRCDIWCIDYEYWNYYDDLLDCVESGDMELYDDCPESWKTDDWCDCDCIVSAEWAEEEWKNACEAQGNICGGLLLEQ